MGKYWKKCSICNKKILRPPDFINELICLTCRNKRKQKFCLNCGKEFYPYKIYRKYCSQMCSGKRNGKSILKGRVLSKKHKEALSKAAGSNKNGYKTKYYTVFCDYLNKEINVQGTYELKYALYLNDHKIKWTRGKNINIQYQLNKEDIIRNYYPDFYLIDTQEYIETKGYFYPDDIIKMEVVKNQNPDKKIKILFYEDLKNIGIIF